MGDICHRGTITGCRDLALLNYPPALYPYYGLYLDLFVASHRLSYAVSCFTSLQSIYPIPVFPLSDI
jgi:hypothetical protein